ncbi:MAG TPA: AMP-binding protein [Ilumatobacteraceae bacterium]|nr:AMP-binding protein [Ilumatobacteraceae bacterium]
MHYVDPDNRHWGCDMVATLQARVNERGDQLAIADEFRSLTWAEFNTRQNQLIHGLRALGLTVGDTIAVLGNNRIEWVEALGAGSGVGTVLVPINWHFSVDEIAYILENSGATALVADAEFADNAVAAAEQAGIGVRIGYGGPIPGFADFEDVVASGSPDEPEHEAAGATMFYTSGTTGRPKGVKSNLQTVGGDPKEANDRLALLMGLYGMPESDGNVVLCNAPLYHAGPLAACGVPFILGAALILRRKWDAAETLRLIDEYQVTNYYAVPTHFSRLLKLSDDVRAGFSGASLQYVLHTAAPCPPEVKRRMIDWWGPVIYEIYGASEGGGVGTMVTPEQWLAKPGTVGLPTAITELLILGEQGDQLGPNETGQIYVRSLLGIDFEYLGDEEKTSGAHLEPGVFSYGDVGYVDDDGFLFLSDRKIDMIISGGVNIYPAEIESVIMTHPQVADCGVFGIPNDEFGEEVKAAVELLPGADAEQVRVELTNLCREKLAGYMVPRSYDFGDLPRTATGKLPKRELRQKYWEGTGRSI